MGGMFFVFLKQNLFSIKFWLQDLQIARSLKMC